MKAYFKRLSQDWMLIRGAAYVLLLCLVVVTLLLAYAYWAYATSREKLAETTNQLAAIQAQAEQTQTELTTLQSNEKDYQWLMSHHVLDKEQRLDWVEELTRHNKSNNLKVEYTVEPQRPFEWLPPPVEGVESYQMNVSRMKLHVDALHEGWWLDLLTSLEQNANGLFVIRRCKVDLNETALSAIEKILPLSSDCDLDWYSIVKPVAAAPDGAGLDAGVSQ